MNVKTTEPLKNNYVIDASGVGVPNFEYTSESLQDMIIEDLHSNFNCITFSSIQVKLEDNIYTETNTLNNTHLDVRLFIKTNNCEDSEQMLTLITHYLKKEFIYGH